MEPTETIFKEYGYSLLERGMARVLQESTRARKRERRERGEREERERGERGERERERERGCKRGLLDAYSDKARG